MSTLDALYYPFSRCLEISQMKQMLLLFDSISFVDPVEDEYWRSKLIRDIEPEHNGFKAYRNLSDCLPWLRKDGIVKIVDPQLLHTINNPLTTAATLSDLSDVNWKHAANPVKFSLPTQYFGNNQLPCWNIFSQKIPSAIAELLRTEKTLSKHLLDDGGEEYAWSVSYEAGSAISINVHLLAADELGLAPVDQPHLIGPVRMLVHGWPFLQRDYGFRCWWFIAKRAVGAFGVVVIAPLLDDDLGFPQRIEYLSI